MCNVIAFYPLKHAIIIIKKNNNSKLFFAGLREMILISKYKITN
jgi:hypothetical protein